MTINQVRKEYISKIIAMLLTILMVLPSPAIALARSTTEPTKQTTATELGSKPTQQATTTQPDKERQATTTETENVEEEQATTTCLLYTSPSPRDRTRSRMPSSA